MTIWSPKRGTGIPKGKCHGDWDWDGAHSPRSRSDPLPKSQRGFSVGCFQWVKKTHGKELKRSPVTIRFSGSIENAEIVYDQADAFCVKMTEHRVSFVRAEYK